MCLALVMVVAGVSMLATALPHLAADIGASQSSQQWIVDAYALTLAALLLPAGALGDRYGRRGTLIAGIALFGGASAFGAFAGSWGPGSGRLVLGIIEGPVRGWTDPVTLVGLVGGAVFLTAFVRAELRTEEPMLDPRLFAHRGFASGSVSLFLQFFAMFGFFF